MASDIFEVSEPSYVVEADDATVTIVTVGEPGPIGPQGPSGGAVSGATPQPLGTPAPGSAIDVSASDHVHAHGNQAGGSLHANVVAGGASGFMTGAQATQLAATASQAYVDAADATIDGHATQLASGSQPGRLSASDFSKLAAFASASAYALLAGAAFTGAVSVTSDIGTAHTPRMTLANGGTAGAGSQKWGPVRRQSGSVWETTTPGAVSVSFDEQLETTQGTSATRSALVRYGFSFAGGTQVDALVLTGTGAMQLGAANTIASSAGVVAINLASGFVILGSQTATTLIEAAANGLQLRQTGVTFALATSTASTWSNLSGGASPGDYEHKGGAVVAGTAAKRGGNLTISGGVGTGNTGSVATATSSIILATPDPTTGTLQQGAAVARLTIATTKVTAAVPIELLAVATGSLPTPTRGGWAAYDTTLDKLVISNNALAWVAQT